MNIVWLKNKNLVEYDSTEKTQLILYKKEGSQFFIDKIYMIKINNKINCIYTHVHTHIKELVTRSKKKNLSFN
jgi:hypothetical protein